MATSTATPEVSSAAAPAAAPVSPPSTPSTPSAPVTTPAAPPATAPPIAEPVTPTADDGPKPLPGEENMSLAEKLTARTKQVLDEANKPVVQEAAPVEAAAADVPFKDEAKAPVVEEAKADATTGEVKTDEESFLSDEDLLDEEPAFLTPEAAFKNPELKAVLEKDPALKANVMHTLRQANKALAVLNEVPNVQTAQFLKKQTSQMDKIEKTFISIAGDDAKSASEKMIGIMAELDFVRDEDTGKPVLNAEGKPETYGYAANFLIQVNDYYLNSLEDQAKLKNDERTLDAIAVIRESKTRTSPASDQELSPEAKAEREQFQADKKTLETRIAGERTEKRKAIESGIRERAQKFLVDKLILPYCTKAKLDAFTTEAMVTKARGMALEQLATVPGFAEQRDYLVAQPQTKDVQKQREDNVKEAYATLVPKIMRKLMGERNKDIMDTQAARDNKQQLAEAGSRHEPKTAAAAPAPAPAKSRDQSIDDWEKEYMASHDGDKPSMAERVAFSSSLRR